MKRESLKFFNIDKTHWEEIWENYTCHQAKHCVEEHCLLAHHGQIAENQGVREKAKIAGENRHMIFEEFTRFFYYYFSTEIMESRGQ